MFLHIFHNQQRLYKNQIDYRHRYGYQKGHDLQAHQRHPVHLVATFNNGTGKLYVNGEYKSSVTTPYTVVGWWVLGDVTPSFNGKMDEIRIYDRELNAKEVAYLYNHFTTK